MSGEISPTYFRIRTPTPTPTRGFGIANSPGRSINFAIEVDGAAVGGIGARAGEGIFVRTAQFGYWLGESYWGRGIVTAAAARCSST